MSNENPEQAALLAALKDTQQAIGQLQKPLESLALTQLITLYYSNNNSNQSVAVLIEQYQKYCNDLTNTKAEIEEMDKEAGKIKEPFAANVNKAMNGHKRDAKIVELNTLNKFKAEFECEHPLIVKLVHSIDAIQ